MRQYEETLLKQLQDKEIIEMIDGMEILMKKVPDDDRDHVLDPRVLEIAKKKKAMFSDRAKGGFKLSNERYRPDKITYDLTTVDIDIQEILIPIQDDHMIDLYMYRRSDDVEKLPVLIYLHGGGFTAGDMHLFTNQMKYIAELSHGLVCFPEYRLAPECPYPAAIEDAIGTIQWVKDHAEELNVDVDRIMVAGDSAGGSLTNACILKDDQHVIKKAVEIYPGVDMSDYTKQTRYSWSYDAYPIIEEQKEYAYSRVDRIKNGSGLSPKDSLYLQGKTTNEDPLTSAVFASDEQLRKFPPTIIVASEYDYLRVGSDYFAKHLKELGVEVTSIRYCGCDHGFFDLLGTLVQAEDLCHVMAKELQTI